VDKSADVEMAVKIAVDSKAQNVAVCNACETLLVHRDIAADFLPKPRGMMRSMSASSFSMAATSSRECSSCAKSAGSPTSAAVCHVYVDKSADVEMAVKIAVDSKAQNVAVCNACACGRGG